MTNSAELHPTRIPGYQGELFSHLPEVLDERLFWLSHLHSCPRSEEAEELLLGADLWGASGFQYWLLRRDDWSVFTVPLADRHRLYVVYRAFYAPAGQEHFFTWSVDGTSRKTPAATDGDGIGVGSTLADLRAAYGEQRVRLFDPIEPRMQHGFAVTAGDETTLSGWFTGEVVSTLQAGYLCGE